MGERFNCQIDIEIGPIQVMRTRQLDTRDLTDGRILEPRELLEWRKQFLLANQDPEPVGRDVGDFN
jgi:hypothetical protein